MSTNSTCVDYEYMRGYQDGFNAALKRGTQSTAHNSDYAADLASQLSHIVRDRTGCDYELRRTLYEDFCKVLNASTHFA